MQLKNVLLLTTAVVGASAAHESMGQLANAARGAHSQMQKRGKFVKAVSPAKPVETATVASITSTTSTSTSDIGDALESLVNGVGDAIGDAIYKAFCTGGSGVSKRASTESIAYKGNTGTDDSYGCNMMQISPSIASQYSYVLQLKNVASESYQVVCFNKIGRKGLIDGFFVGQGETVTLDLAAGESATIALEANTQGSCAWGPGKVPTTAEKCYAGTWVEFDVESAVNKGWSGADCSSLVAEDTGNSVYGCRVCDEGEKTCSTIYEDGSGDNAFTKGTNDLDGLGLNIVPGNATLYVDIGYSK